MSIHYGICAGPIDELRRIVVDEKEAWVGSLTSSADLSIQKESLFGGIKKEGGVSGTATYLAGDQNQEMPTILATKLGLTTDTCPGYRGISSIFFHNGRALPYQGGTNTEPTTPIEEIVQLLGGMSSGQGGFYWRANSPYVPGTWIEVKRTPKGLGTATAMIGNDANPAHMLYETMTNTDWGMGAPSSSFDIQSFLGSAQTLFNENFGMSLVWTQQTEIQEFATTIINHIEGVIFVNPSNGLITLKLIRDDYDPDTLFTITPDNATLSSFQRKLWSETTNEIVVSWTNPENEETETVTAQDPGNIAMQGGVVSDSKNYVGIRNSDLAMKTAMRDLRVAASPLATCEAVVDRNAWNIVPGSVVKLTWPEHGAEEVVMRVGIVDYGKTNDSKVRVVLTEDVFSLPQGNYVTPPKSGWVNPSQTPTPMLYSLAFTLPYYFVRNLGTDFTGNTYPEVAVGVLGAQTGNDTPEFALAFETMNAAGVPVIEEGATLTSTSRGTLDLAIAAEAVTSVAINDVTQGPGAFIGTFALLGTTDENMELAVITNIEGNIITLNRGVLDTTPKEWPADSPIWFIGENNVISDAETRIGGQSMEYRLLSITSKGMLSYADAGSVEADLTERPWLPSRPANVKINNIGYGLVDAVEATSISVTWANRNRLMEDAVVLKWTEGNTAPESGQTTTVSVFDVAGNLITTHDGLTGTSFNLPKASFGTSSVGVVRITSKRDGLESLQGHEIKVKVANGGYGLAYGLNYGG
ncbi:phage tail protein [Ochrobactrum sp. GPK 3]